MTLAFLANGRDFPNASKSRLDMERMKCYQSKQVTSPFTRFLFNIPTFSMDNQCSLALEKLFKGITLLHLAFLWCSLSTCKKNIVSGLDAAPVAKQEL